MLLEFVPSNRYYRNQSKQNFFRDVYTNLCRQNKYEKILNVFYSQFLFI